MGVIQNIRNRVGRALIGKGAIVRPATGWGSNGGGWSSWSNSNPNHPLIQLLDDCNDGAIFAGDPRTNLSIYRALNASIPIYTKNRETQIYAMGNPVLVSDDPQLQDILDELQETFSIHSRSRDEIILSQGFSKFSRILTRIRAIDGMAFGEMTRPGEDHAGNIARRMREPMDGIILYDSTMFEYLDPEAKGERLYVTDQTGQHVIEPSANFIGSRQGFSTLYKWGDPGAKDTEFYAQQLIKTLIDRGETWRRIANPPGIWKIAADDEHLSRASGPLGKTYRDSIDAAKARLETALNSANNANKKDRHGFDIVTSFPAKIDMEQFMYGQGIGFMTEFAEEIKSHETMIARKLPTPLSFMGMQTQNTGMGEAPWENDARQLIDQGKIQQNDIEPALYKAIRAHLISRKDLRDNWLIPDAYRIEWKQPEIADLKKVAETRKLEAEYWALLVEAASRIKNEAGQVAFEEWAENQGLESWGNGGFETGGPGFNIDI